MTYCNTPVSLNTLPLAVSQKKTKANTTPSMLSEQVSQQTSSRGDKALTCRVTCREKINRGCVRQGPLSHTYSKAVSVVGSSYAGAAGQQLQPHSSNKTSSSIQSKMGVLQDPQISRELVGEALAPPTDSYLFLDI